MLETQSKVLNLFCISKHYVRLQPKKKSSNALSFPEIHNIEIFGFDIS